MVVSKNDIVTVITTVGEFVGRLESETETEITLTNPRMVVHNQNGMGFANGIAMSGVDQPDKNIFFKTNVVFMTATNKQVSDGWTNFTSSIQIAEP